MPTANTMARTSAATGTRLAVKHLQQFLAAIPHLSVSLPVPGFRDSSVLSARGAKEAAPSVLKC